MGCSEACDLLEVEAGFQLFMWFNCEMRSGREREAALLWFDLFCFAVL